MTSFSMVSSSKAMCLHQAKRTQLLDRKFTTRLNRHRILSKMFTFYSKVVRNALTSIYQNNKQENLCIWKPWSSRIVAKNINTEAGRSYAVNMKSFTVPAGNRNKRPKRTNIEARLHTEFFRGVNLIRSFSIFNK